MVNASITYVPNVKTIVVKCIVQSNFECLSSRHVVCRGKNSERAFENSLSELLQDILDGCAIVERKIRNFIRFASIREYQLFRDRRCSTDKWRVIQGIYFFACQNKISPLCDFFPSSPCTSLVSFAITLSNRYCRLGRVTCNERKSVNTGLTDFLIE